MLKATAVDLVPILLALTIIIMSPAKVCTSSLFESALDIIALRLQYEYIAFT